MIFMAALSAASSVAIGASMMMKPTMVPSSPSFISVSDTNAPNPLEPRSRSASVAQQQRLVDAPGGLRPRLRHQAADVIGDQPARQAARIGVERLGAIRRRQDGAAVSVRPRLPARSRASARSNGRR